MSNERDEYEPHQRANIVVGALHGPQDAFWRALRVVVEEQVEAAIAQERERCCDEVDRIVRKWLYSGEKEASFDEMIEKVRTSGIEP